MNEFQLKYSGNNHQNTDQNKKCQIDSKITDGADFLRKDSIDVQNES